MNLVARALKTGILTVLHTTKGRGACCIVREARSMRGERGREREGEGGGRGERERERERESEGEKDGRDVTIVVLKLTIDELTLSLAKIRTLRMCNCQTNAHRCGTKMAQAFKWCDKLSKSRRDRIACTDAPAFFPIEKKRKDPQNYWK